MSTNAPVTRFRYGTFSVSESLKDRYSSDAPSLSRDYPLPDELPFHHPALEALEGRYPVDDAVGAWFPDFAQQADPLLRPLLCSVSPEEYRSGTIDEARWRSYKLQCSEDPDRAARLPKSPKMTAWLEDTPWESLFRQRGPQDTPRHMDLLISTRPDTFLYMSHGDDWSSCQHCYDGSENEYLPGNFFDTGVGVAMLVPRGLDPWDGDIVIARTTLRAVTVPHLDAPVVVMGRSYHNNQTAAQWLLLHVSRLLEERGTQWGFIEDTNSHQDARCGALGASLSRRASGSYRAKGDPHWRPSGWNHPYIEGGDASWHRMAGGEGRSRLHVNVVLFGEGALTLEAAA